MTLLATDFPRRTGADVSVVVLLSGRQALAQAPSRRGQWCTTKRCHFFADATVPELLTRPWPGSLDCSRIVRQLRIGFAASSRPLARRDATRRQAAERDALQGTQARRLAPTVLLSLPYDAAMNPVKALPATTRWADGPAGEHSQAEVVARLVSGRHFAISATAHHLLEQAIGQPSRLPADLYVSAVARGRPNHSALVRMVDGPSR